MTETDKAYLAAFVDGEGTIGLRTTHTSRNYSYKSYVVRLRVVQTNEDVIRWIQVITGVGHIYRRKDYPGLKTAWEWSSAGRDSLKVLHEIYSYLKVKRLQAEIAFKFEETYVGSGFKLGEERIAVRKQLREAMDSAND